MDKNNQEELRSGFWEILDDYKTPGLGGDFTPNLMKRIHSEEPRPVQVVYKLPRFAFPLGVRRLVPALAVLLVGLLIVFLSQQGTREVTDEEIIQNLDILENIELLELESKKDK